MKANSCLLLTLIFLNISAVLCCHAELVLHWPLEEGSGITTAEISGNGHDGVFTNPDANNAWTITALAPVPSGTTAAVNMRKVAASDNYKGVTGKVERSVSAWIKTTELNGNICTWGRDTPSEKFVFRTQSQNGTQGAIRCEVNGGFIVGTQPVVDNNWHHVLAVVPPLEAPDVINIRLYVDGELQGVSASTSKALNTGDLNVFFCRRR